MFHTICPLGCFLIQQGYIWNNNPLNSLDVKLNISHPRSYKGIILSHHLSLLELFRNICKGLMREEALKRFSD